MVHQVNEHTHAYTRDESAGVAEQTHKAIGCGSGPIGGLVGSGNAYESLRTVDAEASHSQNKHHYPGWSLWGQYQEDTHEYRHTHHAEEAGAMCTAL